MIENQEYKGFEVGPIRPPSEADSLLLRITRNCPWNKCTFCGLYKGQKFSLRSSEHIIKDIDSIKFCVDRLKGTQNPDSNQQREELNSLKNELGEKGYWAYYSSLNWYKAGMKSIFLQDANSLIIKPQEMLKILTHIRKQFPEVERITSYSRSQTISRISDEKLKQIADAGLTRIHIGMESANDNILKLVKKGVDKQTHIVAGKKVKKAGIELSEYYMPGLGGLEYSKENALDTADAINQINPDFIRIRTLAVPNETELANDYKNGMFSRTNDTQMVEELLLFIENLDGITSTIKSDHVLNLIPEFEGTLPQDKNKMIDALKWYLDLSDHEKMIYRVGRRTHVMGMREHLNQQNRRNHVENYIKSNGISLENIDASVDEIMKQFI